MYFFFFFLPWKSGCVLLGWIRLLALKIAESEKVFQHMRVEAYFNLEQKSNVTDTSENVPSEQFNFESLKPITSRWTSPPGKFSALDYSRLPITRTFKGNRKKVELSGVRVIGSSKKIAESRVKNVFYWTFYSPVIVEMLIKITESHVTKHSLNRVCVLLFGEVKLFYVRFVNKKNQPPLYVYNTSMRLQNPMFRTPVHWLSPTF